VIYRELVAARMKARDAAGALPKGERQRRVRSGMLQQEHQAVLDRYNLDEATAGRILDWGRRGHWATE
jgi:hypothetical protein